MRKGLCTIGWLLIGIVPFAGCDLRSAEDHVRIASALEEAGNADSALHHLNLALKSEPGFLWAYIERGVILSHQGDQPAAIADYDEVVRRAPSNMTAWFNRALAKGRMDDHTGALTDLEQAMELKSPGWQADRNAPRLVLEVVDNPWAGFDRPEFDVPLNDITHALALTYFELDSAEQAHRWLSHCIARGHHVDESLYTRGLLLLNHGMDSAGCADLEQAAILRHADALRIWSRRCATRH